MRAIQGSVPAALLVLTAWATAGCPADVVPTGGLWPSCGGMLLACGPHGEENCCDSPVVPGGAFDRSNNPNFPARVSTFQLDRFEVTVARFRAFVADYPGNKPPAGAGAHPRIEGSGWKAEWDGNLPEDRGALVAALKCHADFQTWTDEPGPNDSLPMNCLSWYLAFAFCAWDGGRLPTEAEWNYAAAGGSEQREVPWGNGAVDPEHAVYECMGDGSPSGPDMCGIADILKVGSKSPAGDGRWGHADLSGSLMEWTLDWYASPYLSASRDDHANLTQASWRVIRGGSWWHDASLLRSFVRIVDCCAPTYYDELLGVRCAKRP